MNDGPTEGTNKRGYERNECYLEQQKTGCCRKSHDILKIERT